MGITTPKMVRSPTTTGDKAKAFIKQTLKQPEVT